MLVVSWSERWVSPPEHYQCLTLTLNSRGTQVKDQCKVQAWDQVWDLCRDLVRDQFRGLVGLENRVHKARAKAREVQAWWTGICHR